MPLPPIATDCPSPQVFSAIHNFLLTLEKAHRYNLECKEKEEKQKRLEEAKAKANAERNRNRSTSGGGGKGGDRGRQGTVNAAAEPIATDCH